MYRHKNTFFKFEEGKHIPEIEDLRHRNVELAKAFDELAELNRKLLEADLQKSELLEIIMQQLKAESGIDETKILKMLKAGESDKVELKSSARWDIKKSEKNDILLQPIIKTVASFLNTSGGTVIIGVDDNGNILGLENDYLVSHNKNKDGFLVHLSRKLSEILGGDVIEFINTNIHAVSAKDVCVIRVKPSTKPFYIKEGDDERLYTRNTGNNQRLTSREAIEYHKNHWK
jgi:hypothetical protein